jgi:hypothetical protein
VDSRKRRRRERRRRRRKDSMDGGGECLLGVTRHAHACAFL